MASTISLVEKRPIIFVDLFKKKDLIEGFFQKKTYQLSAFSFANLYLWKDFFDFELKVIEGNLCIFARHSLGLFLYLPPLGFKMSAQAIVECFDIMDETNEQPGFSSIENVGEEQLSLFDPARFSFFKKSDEYIYEREEIVALKGNKFKSKRHAYNHFVSHYQAEFLTFEERYQPECDRLYESWAKQRAKVHPDDIYEEMLKENHQVHRLALKEYQKLGLVGRVVVIDKAICGYTFGYQLNPQTFCILFEITDLTKDGLAVYIFKEFCADKELSRFRFINAMDDFGMANIKATKLSYRPCQVIPTYVISRKTQ